MQCTRNVTNHIIWVGANDRRLNLFENLFPIPRGVSYNAYLIKDEKNTLMDTVDASASRQFIENVAYALNGESLDYLVVQHMEPDHCANIQKILELYPEAKVVGNAKTMQMIGQFFDVDLEDRKIVVKEGDTLELGSHTLHFVMAPMVHWPEVMVSYEASEKILFSADAFGTFGALNGNLFNDDVDFEKDWIDDARRYFTNIVGKYGPQVQKLLKAAATLDIQTICPLHGPVLNENLDFYLNLYQTWSAYEPEDKGVLIAYTSVYGNTKKAAELLAQMLVDKGCEKVAITDLARDDIAEAVEDAFRYDRLVLATTTYNGDVFPFMREFIESLTERNYQKRTIGLIENGSWAATAAKVMRQLFEKSKEITFTETTVKIMSALNEESTTQLENLAEELCK